MLMEQETIKILYIGVFIVMGISLVFVVGQWISTKKAAYVWLIGHLIVLSITIIRWVSFLSNTNMQQSHMAAENNSLFIWKQCSPMGNRHVFIVNWYL